MTKQDVYEFLLRHRGRKFGPTEIAKTLSLSRSTIQPQCKRLHKDGKIQRDADGRYCTITVGVGEMVTAVFDKIIQSGTTAGILVASTNFWI